MFLYWQGYEIDGSDTDFDIVLPENRELVAFVKCFLSIPLFGDSSPRIHYANAEPYIERDLSREELFELLKQGDRPTLYIDVNCKIMDELPPDIQAKIYALSASREPHEAAYGKVENPCMAPVRQFYHARGEMTVSLCIQRSGTKKQWYAGQEASVEGFVRNESLMRSVDEDYPCFSINVGPGFYYEYAIFIMRYLIDHFPGLGTAGGLDCGGGWVGGCTYASSIYAFEKIRLPVKHNLKNTLRHLAEYDLARSYRRYYKNGWHHDPISEFRMENIPEEKWGKEYLLTYSEYLHHTEQSLGSAKNAVDPLLDTATHILLPMSSRFTQHPSIAVRLKAALLDMDDINNHWNYTGYMAFTSLDGMEVCEFRIPWYTKKYFLLLLELIDSREIDFIKSEIYERHHD